MIDPGWSQDQIKAYILELPLWREPRATPLLGGLTNLSWLIDDSSTRSVARVGFDIVPHDMYDRFIRTAICAAADIGVNPKLRHIEPSLAVMEYVPGGSLSLDDLKNWVQVEQVLSLLRTLHRGTSRLIGPTRYVSYFETVRGYCRQLRALESRVTPDLSEYEKLADALEDEVLPFAPAFTQNDPLPQNFIRDGRGGLKLVDWDHGGVGHPFNDVAGFLVNSEIPRELWPHALQAYGVPADRIAVRQLSIFAVIATLREYLWAPLQELVSVVPGEKVAAAMGNLFPGEAADYVGYGAVNHRRFLRVLAEHRQEFGGP
ncbi:MULTISPECIES: phosphotransferase [unclassified Hyphomicrobium]|uniref:phosphotransferase n=1 Tax=unclassified Hyphomicrobium TaxID=2619925 RepID=UPI000213E6C9|nr:MULTISPECIES: phosphotransferase [unclassified Hyphomicrobium]CCB67137.1 putative Choline/ethanolamine kinase [Hyphomicrobium sp. MC1]